MFCSVFVKDTVSVIQLSMLQSNFLLIDLYFQCFNQPQSCNKSYAKCCKSTDLQTYFSEKNIWHSSQVFLGIAFPKFQGNRSVLRNGDRVWLFDCNFLSEPFCLSYVIRRSDFQTKILKVEI